MREVCEQLNLIPFQSQLHKNYPHAQKCTTIFGGATAPPAPPLGTALTLAFNMHAPELPSVALLESAAALFVFQVSRSVLVM